MSSRIWTTAAALVVLGVSAGLLATQRAKAQGTDAGTMTE
jgi:hypothetical protein